jgi:hypothetical protein
LLLLLLLLLCLLLLLLCLLLLLLLLLLLVVVVVGFSFSFFFFFLGSSTFFLTPGTPSDVLPKGLHCHYERGSEAEILRILTSPRVVTMEVVDHTAVKDLLELVAQSNYNALIGTWRVDFVFLLLSLISSFFFLKC